MKPPRFAYHSPQQLDQAVQLMEKYGGNARVLSGGQSLIPMLNFRLLTPEALIDLRQVPEIAHIRIEGDKLCIGAMTRQRTAEASALVAQHLPLLTEALGWVGHLPTRSRGTIGGSIAHADPSAELPMTLLALDGTVVVTGAEGRREISADDLFSSFFATTLAPTEILTEVRIPVMTPDSGYAIEEYARRKGDFAIVGIAAALRGDGRGCTRARLVAAGVGGRPLRLRAAEDLLVKNGLGAGSIAAAAIAAIEGVQPTSDPGASADYRRHLTGVLAERAILRAANMLKAPRHG